MLAGAVVCFCIISLTVGYLAPRWMHLGPRQAIAVSLEIGVHNAALAMGIALSPQLLNNAEMATPAAVYGGFAPFLALTFALAVRRLDPAFRAVSSPDRREGTLRLGADASGDRTLRSRRKWRRVRMGPSGSTAPERRHENEKGQKAHEDSKQP